MVLILILASVVLYLVVRNIRDRRGCTEEPDPVVQPTTREDIATAKLRYTIRNCEKEREALRQRMENLQELYEIESREVEAAERSGDDRRKASAIRRIMTLDNQIAAVEKKERKLWHDWNVAHMKLSA